MSSVQVSNNGTPNPFTTYPGAPLALVIDHDVDETPFVSIVLEDSETGSTIADVFIDSEVEADEFLRVVKAAVDGFKKKVRVEPST